MSHINFISIKNWSRQRWLDFREQGTGGSELGGILGQSKWDDQLKIFLNKIGEDVSTFTGNRFTEAGTWLEDGIADMFQYYNIDVEDPTMAMYANRKLRRKIFTVRTEDAYVVNSKYPWLFASIDRRILRNKKLGTGRGILECKNTTAAEKNTYTHGINPSHVLQIYQYLMILEWDYAKVFVFSDGNTWSCVEFEPDKEIFQTIEYETAKFWQLVEKGRSIKKEYGIEKYYGMPDFAFDSKQLDGVAMLQALEPEITHISYEWIKDFMKPSIEYSEMVGTQELFELGVKKSAASKEVALAKKVDMKWKASIIAALKGTHVAKYDDGVISYKPDSRGISKVHVSAKLMK